MKKYKLILLLLVLSSMVFNTYAQDDTDKDDETKIVEKKKEEKHISLSLDLMSRYVWRGSDLGASPSIQPGIEYNKSGIKLGAWGAYAINNQGYQESDIYIGYTFYKKKFTLMATDYYFQDDLTDVNYFDYNKDTTGHVFEASLTFNGSEKLPLTVMIATNIYGADAKKINNDNTIGKNQYSTYAELTYAFKNFDAFIGANLTDMDTDKGEIGYYGNGIGIVNIGISKSKDIKITKDFSLPLTLSLITNPQAGKIYFVGGFTF